MLTSQQVTDAYYLEVRCKLLEIAAVFDRHDRGGADFLESDDPRWHKCRQALDVLQQATDKPNRAEQIALIFSDPAED